MTMQEKINLLKKHSTRVGGENDHHFRLNFNRYSEPEITSLGFQSANGCVYVNDRVEGVVYDTSADREYSIRDREVVKLLLAYAESEGIPISQTLAKAVGYEVGSYGVTKEEQETYTREEVVEMLREMQVEAAKCCGFFAGHVTNLWVVKDLIGKRIEEMGGESISYTIQ